MCKGASPITSRLRIALVEGQDLSKARNVKDSHDAYSNRCVSLTPASEKHLQGQPNLSNLSVRCSFAKLDYSDIGAWSHINTERVQPYQEMQVWDGISGARISFDWTESATPASS